MGKISVVINTLNEEENLPRAIASVKGFADEIVVCDMHSDDKTRDIAKRFGAKVYEHERTGYVEPARNFAISKTEGEWVLILDADEELPHGLGKNLKELSGNPTADYFRIPRKNIIFGKWIKHSRWWPDYNIRFFKKGNVAWSEIIHAVPITKGKGLDLEAKEENALVHHNYETIEQYIERLNRYTTHQSRFLIKSGYKFEWKDIISQPSQEFFARYFEGEGYKDGVHGLVLSFLQAFSELVLYLKVWQNERFAEQKVEIRKVVSEIKKNQIELNYWQADTLLKNGGGISERFKRKFKLP